MLLVRIGSRAPILAKHPLINIHNSSNTADDFTLRVLRSVRQSFHWTGQGEPPMVHLLHRAPKECKSDAVLFTCVSQ